MTVITEVTDAGRLLPLVSPAAPAYYVLHRAGFRQMGAPAHGEATLSAAEMEQVLTRSLATNGYRPAELPLRAPSLLIIYTWGSHNLVSHIDWTLYEENNPRYPGSYAPRGFDSATEIRRNFLDRAALVGGDKFAEKLHTLLKEADAMAVGTPPEFFAYINPIEVYKKSNPKYAQLVEHTAEALYYVVASAYDYHGAAKGDRKLLWRTRMTVNSGGLSQPQTLAPLMALAAPYFGKEMSEPEYISKRVGEGKVEVGIPTVVETPLPVSPSEADTGKR